jgi:hypothetical protein
MVTAADMIGSLQSSCLFSLIAVELNLCLDELHHQHSEFVRALPTQSPLVPARYFQFSCQLMDFLYFNTYCN